MVSDNVNHLQLLRQNIEAVALQKQQIESQLSELSSALSEIKQTEKTYKILGRIMVATSRDQLQKDLTEKKDLAEIRLKNFDEQEKRIQKEMEGAQKKYVKDIKKEESSEQ